MFSLAFGGQKQAGQQEAKDPSTWIFLKKIYFANICYLKFMEYLRM